MLLQDAPAETLNYMLLGFGVILGTIALYILSVWIRMRNTRRDLALLEEMKPPAR
ncbi:MAG TPA: hypothetical protein VLL77_05325 [Anaerolineales bacterium]|nr:hypothetical protein [Anaerolineales bacterium]